MKVYIKRYFDGYAVIFVNDVGGVISRFYVTDLVIEDSIVSEIRESRIKERALVSS